MCTVLVTGENKSGFDVALGEAGHGHMTVHLMESPFLQGSCLSAVKVLLVESACLIVSMGVSGMLWTFYLNQAASLIGSLHIGYAMKPRGLWDFRRPRKPNMDTRAQSARVFIGFQGPGSKIP